MKNFIQSKRNQSAFEFITLLCFVLFFFVLFYSALQLSIGDKIQERNELALKDMAYTLKQEIDLASSASNGYTREFEVVSRIGGVSCNASIISGMVYVRTEIDYLAVPIPNVNGDFVVGKNIIKKENNVVYLN